MLVAVLCSCVAGWVACDWYGRQRYVRFAERLTASELEALDRVAANVHAREELDRMGPRFLP